MQSLRKRQLSRPPPADYSLPNKQPIFMDRLSDAIKNFKKKQDFYVKVLFIVPQPQRPFTSKQEGSDHRHINLKVHELQSEHEEMVGEEEQIFSHIKKFQNEQFFMSKTYLYTVFVRLTQIIQSARQKVFTKVKNVQNNLKSGWERIYDDSKLSLVECYQNLIYFQTYDVTQLLNVAKRKQNHRIFGLVPPKVRKSQITLNPLQRSDSSKFTKTSSVEMPSPMKKEKLQSIIEVKLGKKKSKKSVKSVMEKKEEEEKRVREKNPFKYLYGIMNIRLIKVENRKDMEEETLDRNEGIMMMRQEYREKLELRNIYIKLSKKKKTQESGKEENLD